MISIAFLLFSSSIFAQIKIDKGTKTSSDDIQLLKNIEENYKLFMIPNQHLNSFFSFNDFVFYSSGEVKSFKAIQWKGLHVIEFVKHKITTADKDNGITKSITPNMRIDSKRIISVDKFPGKTPIIDVGDWIALNDPLTPSAEYRDGKWKYDDLLDRFMEKTNTFNHEIEKISQFSKLNLLQSCKKEECIKLTLSEFK
jgi:hypothetical protein